MNAKTIKRSKKVLFILLVFYSGSLLVVSTFSNNKNNNSGLRCLESSATSSESAQQVVDFFREVFQSDWGRGEAYDSNVDGFGFTQSRTLYGSGYTPYSAKQITDTMKITPILSPDNSEQEIINLINSATSSLDIEYMYLYYSLTDIKNAIINAHNRGVTVRVIVNDDDGSKEMADALAAAGIEVKVCNGNVPMYFDTQHNKGIIVDSIKVLIASINGSPTSLRENREAGLIIESDQVTSYYQTLFNHDWSVCETYDSSIHLLSTERNDLRISSLDETVPQSSYTNEFSTTKTYEGQMTIDAIAAPDNCFDVVANLLEGATTSIDISVYTLSHPYLLDILVDRISAGVSVRLILEKYPVSSYEKGYNRFSLYNLTELHSAQGKWASSDFDFQHCKYSIIDDDTLILSSGNWARTSCPKPQTDGDIDGNRDWWIVLYGGNPTTLNTGSDSDSELEDLINEIPGYPLALFLSTTFFGIVILLIRKKQ